ncbi:NRDE family protein [Echinicola marina]|uniref:NRDE family protein n=1 Tax=Echinicola marina TaxID=2859768 RepID=UPI001CF627AA|nr:NRDE family protein [Echinicola marina]UCS95317.1 NRDE family protein [Echinicola marina]
MCLITFAWKTHPKYSLILVANRDEFFTRPTLPLFQWENGIYAGKDLKAGGTWMGIHPRGRFAALTNYRDLKNQKAQAQSRGGLVLDFLKGTSSPKSYLAEVEAKQDQFDGFNLLVGNQEEMWYLSNYGESPVEIPAGIHGLSNSFINVPWKKVRESKMRLQEVIKQGEIAPDDLLEVNMTKQEEELEKLPDTGLPIALEKAVSAAFIEPVDRYGTVGLSALLWEKEGQKVQFLEKQVLETGGFKDRLMEFDINGG